MSIDVALSDLIPSRRKSLAARLQRDIEGDVLFDAQSRALYAQDASNYLHVPIGVVRPRTDQDVEATLEICRQAGAPVVSRGGGTALAGQAANEAVVIDFSRHMTRILELDGRARRAKVQPGVVCDDLVRAAQPFGLTWGPKPATHDHCCFGGMVANNCGGMHAQYAGVALDNVEAMRVVLYQGIGLELGWTDEQELRARAAGASAAAGICAKLVEFRDRHAALIRERLPRLPRRVSGYALEALLPDDQGRFNLARSLVGSEGTCVTMLDITLRLVDDFPEREVVVLGYPDVYAAADHVPELLHYRPLALEGMDDVLRSHVRDKHLPERRHLHLLPEGRGWLLLELGARDRAELDARVEDLLAHARTLGSAAPSVARIRDREEQEQLWKIREAGLGATAFVPGRPDTWPGFEDSAVRPERLGSYLRDLRRLFDRYGFEAALYGHFGMGCVHCRVPFELTTARGIEQYRAFMGEAAELVAGKYGGSLSGEHGDGQARGELLPKMFDPEVMQAFREFKAIWDPLQGMNPGRLLSARPLDADLRLGPGYTPWQPETHFKFPDDGGSFARATLRCVGVGKCRRLHGKPEDDTMCPSYMVTREEQHSTRGRAHLLWEMFRGEGTPIQGRWRDENVKSALDLCLSCKGCKGDCPVNVDVATYKAEFLAHYYEGRLRPRHAYAFGFIDRWARMASLAPGLSNLLTQMPGLSRLLKLVAGMTAERDIPVFAPETFRAWFAAREARPTRERRVLLWPDTFNNHFYPDTAKAATQVLEHLGFEVQLPDEPLCCGRPLYDYGWVERARGRLERVLDVLSPHIAAGTPLLVLEPSCCSVFRDELKGLLPQDERARRLARQTVTLSELLGEQLPRLPRLERNAVVQGHCHHKAIMRLDADKALFGAMGLQARVLDSGCCGLAGSFGFEHDKHAVAQACAERALLPALREQPESTLVLADGFSCRTQIEHGSTRQGLHLAEALKLALDFGPAGPPAREAPERALVAERRAAVRASMRRALGGVLIALGLAAGTGMLVRYHSGRWLGSGS